jgi:hypothetical protein
MLSQKITTAIIISILWLTLLGSFISLVDAQTFEPSVNFELTLEAANELLTRAYYEEKFRTRIIHDVQTAEGIFKINIKMHQPKSENVNIYAGNLYVDFLWHISGYYSIDGHGDSIDKRVRIRIGLVKEKHLRFAMGQIQI